MEGRIRRRGAAGDRQRPAALVTVQEVRLLAARPEINCPAP